MAPGGRLAISNDIIVPMHAYQFHPEFGANLKHGWGRRTYQSMNLCLPHCGKYSESGGAPHAVCHSRHISHCLEMFCLKTLHLLQTASVSTSGGTLQSAHKWPQPLLMAAVRPKVLEVCHLILRSQSEGERGRLHHNNHLTMTHCFHLK